MTLLAAAHSRLLPVERLPAVRTLLVTELVAHNLPHLEMPLADRRILLHRPGEVTDRTQRRLVEGQADCSHLGGQTVDRSRLEGAPAGRNHRPAVAHNHQWPANNRQKNRMTNMYKT